jgi:hypothetical protein
MQVHLSTLTTDSSFVDLKVDSGGGVVTQLLPLTSILYCPFIEESANSQNRKMSWLCKWCVVNVLAEALITGDSACVENEVG